MLWGFQSMAQPLAGPKKSLMEVWGIVLHLTPELVFLKSESADPRECEDGIGTSLSLHT